MLFEIATVGPGFATDEPAERLGEELRLPPQYEPLRSASKGSSSPREPAGVGPAGGGAR